MAIEHKIVDVAQFLSDSGYYNALRGLCRDLNIDDFDGNTDLVQLISARVTTNSTKTGGDAPIDVALGGSTWSGKIQMVTTALVVDVIIYADGDTGPKIFAALADKSIQVWDMHGNLLDTILDVHPGAAIKQIRQCRRNVVTGSLNGELALIEASPPYKIIARKKAHRRIVACVDTSNDFVVSGGFDAKVVLYSDQLHQLAETTMRTGITALSLCKYNDMDAVVVGCHDLTTLVILDTPNLSVLHRIDLCDAEFGSYTFTPMGISLDSVAGCYVVATNHTPYMRLLTGRLNGDTPDRNLLTLIQQTKFSDPDIVLNSSRTVIAAGDDGCLREVSLQDGTTLREVRTHSDRVRALCFKTLNHDGVVVSGGADKSIYIWHLSTASTLP